MLMTAVKFILGPSTVNPAKADEACRILEQKQNIFLLDICPYMIRLDLLPPALPIDRIYRPRTRHRVKNRVSDPVRMTEERASPKNQISSLEHSLRPSYKTHPHASHRSGFSEYVTNV